MPDPAPVFSCDSALTVLREVALALDGVQILPYAYGQEGVFLHGNLIGHLHRSGVVAFGCGPDVRDALIRTGEARAHHDDPNLPWVVLTLDRPADLDLATKLLRAARPTYRPEQRWPSQLPSTERSL